MIMSDKKQGEQLTIKIQFLELCDNDAIVDVFAHLYSCCGCVIASEPVKLDAGLPGIGSVTFHHIATEKVAGLSVKVCVSMLPSQPLSRKKLIIHQLTELPRDNYLPILNINKSVWKWWLNHSYRISDFVEKWMTDQNKSVGHSMNNVCLL